MALSVVQSKTGNGGGTVNCTATFSPAATANDLMVGNFFTKSDTGWTNPSGWTTAVSIHNSTNSDDLVIAYKISVGGETAITFVNNSVDQSALVIQEISGNDTANPLDKAGAGTAFSTGVTSISSSSTGTLSQSSEICCACAGIRNVSITSPAVDSSFTPSPPDDATDSSSAVVNTLAATLIVSSTAAQSCNFSWTTAADAMGLIASFRSPPPGASIAWISG